MKTTACDVCAAEGIFAHARWRSGVVRHMRIDLCDKHRGWSKGKAKTGLEFDKMAVDLLSKNKLGG